MILHKLAGVATGSRARLPTAAAACFCVSFAAASSLAAGPVQGLDAVPNIGKGLTNSDDTAGIVENPANLVFLRAPELRWNLFWPGSPAPVSNRGTSVAAGLPLGPLATGLRFDFLYPSSAAPSPFNHDFHVLRWDLALGGEDGAFGTTFAWGSSSDHQIDGYFSMTSGLTLRPMPWLSASFVARDWNRPATQGAVFLGRSFAGGLGIRPWSTRVFEGGFDLVYFEDERAVGGRIALGVDVPRVGRIRGDLTVNPQSDRRFIGGLALDMNMAQLQASAGAVFGSGLTASGTGLYAGAALRLFREPGPVPSRVAVKITLDTVPSVRGHSELLRRLWRLADDPGVHGVVLNLRSEPASSLAHAEELADALDLLRARGKKAVCHLEDNGGRSLFVCAHASRVLMNPAGGLRFAGISSSYFFLGGLLTTLGLRADFVRIGPHKSAAEQLTLTESTPVARKDHQALVDDVTAIYLADIAAGRRMQSEAVRQRLAGGPFIAPEAQAAGFIDGLAYEDEVDRFVAEVMGERTRVVDDDPAPLAPSRWGAQGKVAVVYLNGDMVDGESQYVPFLGIRTAGSHTITAALRRAREDASVKAVVLRVETGGGSSLAADVILREAILTAHDKPLIVSMGTAAASGGYYASVAAREIFANRSTVTGSIGIFYGKVDVVGLLNKIGVSVEQYRSLPRADAESVFRPFTDDERRELGVKVKQFYDLFVARVGEGRRMTPAQVDAVGRGKVWLGAQAATNGLVDKIGGLRQALAEARRLARLPDDAPIVELPEDDDGLLPWLLKVAVHRSGAFAVPALPSPLLALARGVAPFLVFDWARPLALSEITEIDALPTAMSARVGN